jgi:UDP:flavonoid glycosyltransferase YjiC (YdhE family)
MRITIMAAGSRGDIQPCVVLGRALQAAGYDVRLVIPASLGYLADSCGVDYHPISTNFTQLMRSDGAELVAEEKGFVESLRGFSAMVAPILDAMIQDIWQGVQGSDFILTHFLVNVVAQTVAEKLRVPFASIAPTPFAPTRAFSNPMLSGLALPLGGEYNRFTSRIMEGIFWLILRGPLNRFRQETLHLPPQTADGFHRIISRTPYLNAYSPLVVPRPPDWGEHIYDTGYWHLGLPEGWSPPENLAAFIDAGEPPVAIGFGAMTVEPDALRALVLQALEISGQRGVLFGLGEGDTPESVFSVGSVPHAWLFPRVKAVVHHGGCGTTGTSLTHGKPTIIVPFAIDQSFWASRVAALGVGPEPIPNKDLTVEKLAYAIRIAATHAGVHSRAADLGATLRAEDGLGKAVKVVQKLVGK